MANSIQLSTIMNTAKGSAQYVENMESQVEDQESDYEDNERLKDKTIKELAEDEANQFIGEDEDYEIDPVEEKALVRKINWTILPFIAVCYVFFYIDKTTLSYAAIFGIREDLHLDGKEYSWLSAIFYFGYLIWSIPTNYLLLRYPINRYLGANVFAWGAFLMIQAACQNFSGLAAVRAFGGAGESCADPAFLLITSMYYTKVEQPLAIGKWYAFNGLGIAVGGLLGYGLGSINGALASWRYEFLVIGALCATWGIVIFAFLPQNPVRAKWFTQSQKKLIAFRIKQNQTGMETKVWKWYQVKECLLDPKTYLFFLYSFFGNLPNGGISNFGTIIIKGLGYSTLPTTLLQIPYGAYIILVVLLSVYLNQYLSFKLRKNTRAILIICFILPNVAGAFGLYFAPSSAKIGRLFCYYFTGSYNASFVLMLSINTSNTAGHTKKVLTNAILFLGYCVGNIAGPFFFKSSQYPRYSLGMGCLIFSHCAQIVVTAVLGIYLKRENARRDRVQRGQTNIDHGLEDLTDQENLDFRYIY